MKKLVSFLVNLTLGFTSYAQLPTTIDLPDSSRYNFYDLRNLMLENIADMDHSEEDGPYTQFKRWEWFWEQRLYPSGDFNVAANAIRNYASPSVINDPGFLRREQISQVKSLSYPASWKPLGPIGFPKGSSAAKGAGRIQRIAFDPDMPDDSIYVASPFGGLWKSHNESGELVFRNLNTDQLPLCGVADVAVNSTGDTIFIAMGDGDDDYQYSTGMYRSSNGGATWTEVNSGLFTGILAFRLIKKILMHPTNENIIFLATNHGIWKTTNALTSCTWSRVLGADNDVFRGLAFKPNDPTTVYASSQAIYKSTSNGNSGTWGSPFFTPSFSGKTVTSINIAVTPANSAYIYAHIMTRVTADLDATQAYFQRYNGSTWSSATALPMSYVHTESRMPITCSPTNIDTIYAGQELVYRSNNGGTNFNALFSYNGVVHADIHDIKFSTDNSKLYVATDAGLYRTSNPRASTPTWDTISDGLNIATLYGLSNSQSDTNLILMGALDLGSNYYNNSGSPDQPWKIVAGGDGFDAIIDRLYNDTMYSSDNSSPHIYRIKRTLNNWSSSTTFTGPENPPHPTIWLSEWVLPYLQNENNNMIYVGYEDLYKTTSLYSSPTWLRLSSFNADFTTGNCTAIKSFEVSPSNPNFIYVAMRGVAPYGNCDVVPPRLFKSEVGGGYGVSCTGPTSPWCEMTPPDIADITGIAIHPEHPERIWITYSGYTTDKVKYYNGSSWSSYSTGLPAMPINCIVYEKGSADGLYIGTDVGIYYRNKNMSAWEKYSEGLPNVIVNDLEIMYKHNKLRAATFGRGVWESSLACPTDYDISLSGVHAFNYFYEAENNISSTGTIASDRTITYRAGNEIALTNGFGVASGGEFGAFIHPCDHGGNSFNKTDEIENEKLSLQEWQSQVNKTENKMSIFPNPNKGEFTLSLGAENIEIHALLIIRDLTGREISQVMINKPQTLLDLTKEKSGVYFLELNYSDGTVARAKVVKE